MTTDIILDALMIAMWRSKPKQSVMIHFNHGS